MKGIRAGYILCIMSRLEFEMETINTSHGAVWVYCGKGISYFKYCS